MKGNWTREEIEFEEESERLKAVLRPRLTPRFLNTLVEAARTCGDSVDYIEVVAFVEWCFDAAGRPRPHEWEPYQTA